MNVAETMFEKEMIDAYKTIKKEYGYNASRFIQMVANKGAVAAAKQLISKPGGSDGFTVLWEHGCLKLSVEAHVLEPKFQELFTDEERKICEERLKQYDYKFPE